MPARAARSRTWERLLKPFSNVQPGEGARAALMLLCIFLIMTAYYVMKTAREGLILTGGTFGLRGDELKTYATGAMALLLIVLVPAYDMLADRHRRIRLINLSYLLLLASLIAFFVLGEAGVPIGFAYFVWFGLVSAFMVAQFWSYATDLYNEDQGKRLFALIATGGTLGAIIGPHIAKLANTFTLMLIGAGLLVGAIILFNVIEHRAPRERRDKEIEGPGGFALVLGDRSLLMIACLLLLTNVVNSTGEYLLSHAVSEHAIALVPDSSHPELSGAMREAVIGEHRREIIKTFYSNFFIWVNALSFVIQAFLVSRVIKRIGVRHALFILPVIAFGAYWAIGMIGGLAVVRLAKTAENATDYSIQNTVWQSLFLKSDRAVKYKAKATMDTFFVRAGDAISAIVVALGIHQFGFGARELAFVNVALIIVWMGIAFAISHAHRMLQREVQHERHPMRRPSGLIYHYSRRHRDSAAGS
ncbi:MAG TPA: MFS transporter [Kofleriaceae bacterium]